jgi:hypothetical protein
VVGVSLALAIPSKKMRAEENSIRTADAETRRTAMREETRSDRERRGSADAKTQCTDAFAGMRGCCDSVMEGSPRACPCKSVLARHRVAVYAFLALVTAALLTVHVGAILGILAFFRLS